MKSFYLLKKVFTDTLQGIREDFFSFPGSLGFAQKMNNAFYQ